MLYNVLNQWRFKMEHLDLQRSDSSNDINPPH